MTVKEGVYSDFLQENVHVHVHIFIYKFILAFMRVETSFLPRFKRNRTILNFRLECLIFMIALSPQVSRQIIEKSYCFVLLHTKFKFSAYI